MARSIKIKGKDATLGELKGENLSQGRVSRWGQMKCWCGAAMVQLLKKKVCTTTKPKGHEKQKPLEDEYLSEYSRTRTWNITK